VKKILLLSMAGILFLFSSEACAVTGLGVGVRGGTIRNYDNPGLEKFSEFTSGFSLKQMPLLGVHLKIGTLPIIDLEVSAEYAWKKKKDIIYYSEELGKLIPFQGNLTVRDLSLNATAKYSFSFPIVKPYVGAGIGIHRMLYEFSAGETSVYFPEDENKIGFHGVGGLSFKIPVFPLEVFAEGRFVYIKTEQKKLDTKETDFITILAGVTLNL